MEFHPWPEQGLALFAALEQTMSGQSPFGLIHSILICFRENCLSVCLLVCLQKPASACPLIMYVSAYVFKDMLWPLEFKHMF